MRLPLFIFASPALFALACKQEVGSYAFEDAGKEAQQAIATSVEFTLTEDIFRRWERAQAMLDRLPASELERVPDPGGSDPVARGIQRLESSPRARQAIETSGLSVRNFVLATVALAQAVKASRGGVPPTVGAIASNVRFVLAHASRLGTRGAASVWVPPAELPVTGPEMTPMGVDTTPHDIATGAEGAQPTVPQLDDWSLRQTTPPSPPTQDSSGGVPPPPPTDSLLFHLSQELP